MVVLIENTNRQQFKLNKNDVREDFYRASGAGGQHRNKVETAVRLTHVPTGTMVTASEERSQLKNREKAWERLEIRLRENYNQSDTAMVTEAKMKQFRLDDAWSWTDYRDEVKNPCGVTSSMQRALRGDLKKLLK